MLEILLVRHGRVACDHRTPIRGSEFGAWVTGYDSAALDPGSTPPRELVERVAAMPCLVTSTLPRAIASCDLVGDGREADRDAIFDEAAIPTRFPGGLALRPTMWDVLARTGWFLGWSGGGESFREARERAGRAADRLGSLARTHGAVALVGHGMLNALIGRSLRRRGWQGGGSTFGYWSAARWSRSLP